MQSYRLTYTYNNAETKAKDFAPKRKTAKTHKAVQI